MIDPIRHLPAEQLPALTHDAHRSEQATRQAFTRTLEELASDLEHTATLLRRWAREEHVEVSERAEWAEHELRVLLPHLGPERIRRVTQAWSQAAQDRAALDTRRERLADHR